MNFIKSRNKPLNEQNGILILNRQNFYSSILQYKHVLVFYSPACKSSKYLLNVTLVKLSNILKHKGSKVKLTKVNAVKETALANMYRIIYYPTLSYFRSTFLFLSYIKYYGERRISNILKGLNYKHKNEKMLDQNKNICK